MDMGVEEEDPADEHEPSDEVPFGDKPAESAPSASDHPAVPCPTATTLPATHPAPLAPQGYRGDAQCKKKSHTSSDVLINNHSNYGSGSRLYWYASPHLWCDAGRDCATYGDCSQRRVASSSTYTGSRESMPRRHDDDYHRPAMAVYMTGIPGYTAPETGYTMPAPGCTSLSGLRGPESCWEGAEDQKDPQRSP